MIAQSTFNYHWSILNEFIFTSEPDGCGEKFPNQKFTFCWIGKFINFIVSIILCFWNSPLIKKIFTLFLAVQWKENFVMCEFNKKYFVCDDDEIAIHVYSSCVFCAVEE